MTTNDEIELARKVLERNGFTVIRGGADQIEARAHAVLAVLLVDESGSMGGLRAHETRNAVNAFLDTYADTLPGLEKRVTLLTFDARPDRQQVRTLCADVPAAGAVRLSETNYNPSRGGSTPLYDAIGEAIRLADRALERDPHLKVTLVIQTDGLENASRLYTLRQIKALLDARKERGWQVVFLGAELGEAAYQTADSFGIAAAATRSYTVANSAEVFRDVAVGAATFAATGEALAWTDEQKRAQGDTALATGGGSA